MTILLRLLAHVWSGLPGGDGWRTALLKSLGPSFLVSVWAIIFDDNGRVLLFEHTHDRDHPWGLPSGRLEAHESPEHALEREFQEEVGGMLRPGPIVAALRDVPLPALRLVYRCKVAQPPARPSAEVTRWGYFWPNDLPLGVRPLQRRAIGLAGADDESRRLAAATGVRP